MLLSDDLSTLKLGRVRRLTGTSCPDYAAVVRDGSLLTLASERPFKFEFDSVSPVTVANHSTETPGISRRLCNTRRPV